MVSVPERDEHDAPFTRFGLGFQYRPPGVPVVMTFTSVADKPQSGELKVELHVESANGGHIMRRYLNLLGSRSLADLVRDLGSIPGLGGLPWPAILESATESIIQAIRHGPEPESFGGLRDRPPGISWLCEDLVMADVVNVWLAAASTGKSTFAALLALYHALGARFLDRLMQKGVALYLDWESTPDDLAEKLWLGSRWLGLDAVPHGVYRMPMRGPAARHASAIANRIDELGATLVIWDGVQAAGGPIGQYSSYESVAMDLEALVGLLPPTTHVMLDHVTGDDLKGGAVPLKARGGTRKLEWARNQWSLILDRDKHAERRHVVGWTHTKINRGEYLPAFGVEIVHRPDEIGFRLLEEQEVEPLKERMAEWRQLLAVLQEAGRPLSNREAAYRLYGEVNDKTLGKIKRLEAQHPKAFARNDEGGLLLPGDGPNHAGADTGNAAVNGTSRDDGGDPRFDSHGRWSEDEEWQDEQLPF